MGTVYYVVSSFICRNSMTLYFLHCLFMWDLFAFGFRNPIHLVYRMTFIHFTLFLVASVCSSFFPRMWHRILEPFLFALTSHSYHPTSGFAEWILFGLICFFAGVVVGSTTTALLCSPRLRRVLASALLEGLAQIDRQVVVREDRLAGYRHRD